MAALEPLMPPIEDVNCGVLERRQPTTSWPRRARFPVAICLAAACAALLVLHPSIHGAFGHFLNASGKEATSLEAVRNGVAEHLVGTAAGLNTQCPRRTKEWAVSLCMKDFVDRHAGIATFRKLLEDAEDNLKWFRHSKDDGLGFKQKAEYLELPDNALLSQHNMQIRYRRITEGKELNRTDFVVKYKTGKHSYHLKPMTASNLWNSFWNCKLEDNLKYLPCPDKGCFPVDFCSAPCPALGGMSGIGLEAQEQAPKIGSLGNETFAQQYTSASQFQTLADIAAFFPDIVSFFRLGDASASLHVSETQYRYVYDDVYLKFKDAAGIDSTFTLWYASQADLDSRSAEPLRGEWSFRTSVDMWGVEEYAEKLLIYMGTHANSC